MKILHISPSYLPARHYGGPVESVHAMNRALVRQGVEVVVYTTDADGPDRLSVPLGVPVALDGIKIFYFPGSFPRNWFYSGAMKRALRKNVKDFDLVHITSVWLAASALGAHYAKKFGKPYIISPRGSLMRDPMSRKSLKKSVYMALIEKKNVMNAAAVHCTTEAEATDCRNKFGGQRIVVIPNAVSDVPAAGPEETFREKYGIARSEKLALFVGRLHPIKGFDTLIPAMADIVKSLPAAKLAIVGGDEKGYKREIEKMIDNDRLANRVVFTGRLVGREKAAALAAADLFVLPSYSENFGMAAAEAMAAGLPVVLTDGVGIAPEVRRAGAGIIVEKKPDLLARAILDILTGRVDGRAMGERGKHLVTERFSLEAVGEAMAGLYRSIIGK